MLSAGELLNQSFALYKKNFKLLAGYAAWLLLPYVGIILFSLIPSTNPLLEALIIISNLAQGLIGLWLVIFIPQIIREAVLDKKTASAVDLTKKVWLLLPSVVFVAFLETVVILGGLILLLVPGIIFWVWFAWSQMAAILDDKKGLNALSFSRELVRGKFWPVFWRLLAGPLVIGLIIVSISSLIIMIFSPIAGASLNDIFGETPPLWADVVATIVETFIMPILVVYLTVTYLDLKKSKQL